MNIQEAVKVCRRKTKDGKPPLFARPITWEGSGDAIDLGNKLDPKLVRKIFILSSSALTGTAWMVNPEDLLERWQVVTQAQLNCEVNHGTRTDEEAGSAED